MLAATDPTVPYLPALNVKLVCCGSSCVTVAVTDVGLDVAANIG